MKPLLQVVTMLLVPAALAAQEPPREAQTKPEAEQAKTASPTVSQQAEAQEAAPAKETAAATPETTVAGEVELGVRWNQGVQGNRDTYRSIVNLGEGVRLLNWDTRIATPWHAVKRLDLRGVGWGGDPASWLRIGVESPAWYRLSVDYRTTAYFSALPSFANPFAEQGILTSQRSFDTVRRFADVNLDILPTSHITPFAGYSRDAGRGRGVSNFVSDANEYPVLAHIDNQTDMARGGVRLAWNRFHTTLEGGSLWFNDGYRLTGDGRNPGNRARPILGRELFLSDLLQAYDAEGRSGFGRALLSAQPFSWLDLTGSFQFSQPSSDVTYTQANQGLFIDLDSLLFLESQSVRLLSAAEQPHMTASAGAEIRPWARLRILESWFTDRLRNNSALTGTGLEDRLEWSYHEHKSEAVFELVPRVTVRGGYRYTWGDGLARASYLTLAPGERGKLKRHSALAGAGFRLTDRASLNIDTEITRSDQVLFRTSLADYERVRVRGRYQVLTSLHCYGTFQYLDQDNPIDSNRFRFRSQQESLGLQWGAGRSVQVIGDYSRSSIRSDLSFFAPQLLSRQISSYRENAHTVTGLVSWAMAVGWTWQPRISFGGSMLLSSGSRPTDYYQPMARFSAPLYRHVDLFAEYRWYGLAQPFYSYETFRSHQGIVGLRIY